MAPVASVARTRIRPTASGSRPSWRPSQPVSPRPYRRTIRSAYRSSEASVSHVRGDRLGGPEPAADGRPDAFAAEVTRQAGRVPDQAEAGAGQASRCAAPHDVGVPAERLDREIGGQLARGAQRGDQRVPAPGQIRAGARDHADADVEHVLLGEVPAVALEVPLDVQLGRRRHAAQGLAAIGRQPRLALLGDHDLFALGDLAERLGHGAVMPARADHHGRDEGTLLAHDVDPVALAGDRGHPRALPHVGAGDPGAIQEMVVELAPHDAVARRPAPARLMELAVEPEAAGGERLDRERVLVGIDLDVGQRLGRHPARADLHARKGRGIEQQRPQTRAGQAPRRGAPARPPTDHDDVVGRHVTPATGMPRGAGGRPSTGGSLPERQRPSCRRRDPPRCR